MVLLLSWLMLSFSASTARTGELRVALYHTGLARSGPGLLLHEMRRKDDTQVEAVIKVIAASAPDILVLLDLDHDHDLATLDALRDRIAEQGIHYPHIFAMPPNAGVQTHLDLDGDGRLGGPRDAQGYGEFAGQGGMAILSRYPIAMDQVQDHSHFLWRDLPGALLTLPDGTALLTSDALETQRLSTKGHWVVPVDVAGQKLWLLAFHATPPVFDGQEDRNGRRNHDEARFWTLYLNGAFGPAPTDRFVVIGDSNMDPLDSEGRPEAMRALLDDPRLSDPLPKGAGQSTGSSDPNQRGDPSLDTVRWPPPGPGNLRVDYILPSADLTIRDATVLWPHPSDPMASVISAASHHHMVSVTLAWPDLTGAAPE